MVIFRRKQFNEITHLLVHGSEAIEKESNKEKQQKPLRGVPTQQQVQQG